MRHIRRIEEVIAAHCWGGKCTTTLHRSRWMKSSFLVVAPWSPQSDDEEWCYMFVVPDVPDPPVPNTLFTRAQDFLKDYNNWLAALVAAFPGLLHCCFCMHKVGAVLLLSLFMHWLLLHACCIAKNVWLNFFKDALIEHVKNVRNIFAVFYYKNLLPNKSNSHHMMIQIRIQMLLLIETKQKSHHYNHSFFLQNHSPSNFFLCSF